MSIFQHNTIKRFYFLLILFCSICTVSLAQNATTFQGVVKDSLTQELLPYVTIQFDNTTIGVFSDDNGKFKISNRRNKVTVTVSFIGYTSRKFTIPLGQITQKEILLQPESLQLNEVVVRPKKEKYSKKNNPAVDLIEKVIARKKDNNITAQDYYQFKEYERILFALNEFKPEQRQFKRFKFLPSYMDTSLIDDKAILPFSVRETIAEEYYRKDPKSNKRIVKGYSITGVDQMVETEAIDAIVKETFKDISIFDNSITLLLHDFVGPLSDHQAVSFYKWYLSDTTNIDNDRYVKLDFAPFNSRDVGFTGSLYISLDSTYAVRRAILRAPRKMNINFVEELIIQHDFKKTESNVWIPQEQRMAIDISLLDALKIYIDKSRSYHDFVVNKPFDSIHFLDVPVVNEKDYLNKSKEFWAENRTISNKKDYRMDSLVQEMKNVTFFKILFKAGNLISSGYIATSAEEDKNKLDLGTLMTLYSYNPQEGNRFRLTLSTTPNFHKHLYLFGYGAYGTKDGRFKYYGEATWAFNKIERHKDEYPKNNLSVSYKYDLDNLGQRYTQAERDNLLMSLSTVKNRKMTFNREAQVMYDKEYYGGFSFKLSGRTFEQRPVGKLVFEKMDVDGNLFHIDNIKTTEGTLALRYAPNEKFFQQRRKRFPIPSERFAIDLSHTVSLNNVLGGEYNYNKTSFSILKDFWVAPYGKLSFTVEAEKIWGKAPFPLLITPSANSSYTIQKGNFYLLEPLEFVHDAQVSWEVNYRMGGWLFNRIPLLKVLKWREVAGFRGFIGELSKKNNPAYNHDLLLFPQETYTTGSVPYMEYNVGIENIFKFLRVDYVRRINYKNHPDTNKDGFRITFDMTF